MLWKFINPITNSIAGSIFHHLISANIIVLHFSGHKTGKSYAIPVSYHEEPEGTLNCLTETSNIWWRNLVSLNTIRVGYKGRKIESDVSVETNDKEVIQSMLKTMCSKNRVDGFFAKVAYENGEPVERDLELSAGRMTMIQIRIRQ